VSLLHVSPAQARRLQRNLTKGEKPVTPDERKEKGLRANAGWSVQPELKEYIQRRAAEETLEQGRYVSASEYVEGLIIADREIRSMSNEPARRTGKKKT
jgi:hypothetical protein